MRLYKSIVSTNWKNYKKKDQILGRRHSMWNISISQNYELNGMSVKASAARISFSTWLSFFDCAIMEVMKRITIMTIMREMIIVLICLQISLISKRYSRRLSRKQISESYIWKVEFPLRWSQIYYQPKSKVRNQNLSKTIDDVFKKNEFTHFLELTTSNIEK